MIELSEKPVLVIGGGEEGSKKVRILQGFGAHITLVCEKADPDAVALSKRVIEASFAEEMMDLEEFVLVVAATNDREVNQRVSELSRQRAIPVNVVDDVALCTFIFPAIYQDQDVVCAVSSGGKSPYVAQYIRDRLKEVLPTHIGQINAQMGEFRKEVKERVADPAMRRRLLRERFDALIQDEN
ncbi:MAG: bifunctional precorrin-2 dehydrogenase/sirohydrochlorin ferrochelatase [Lachnospiraceae bacterium]|nr:bifunctional precorrin-2 dehydrogenase/sirohydrochlorin ferrochelatase [Lachnospiraceae bacterium]